MIIDKLLSPAIELALSTFSVASNALVGTAMDLKAKKNEGLLAGANDLGWLVDIKGATSAGAATGTLRLVTSDSADLSNPTVLWTGATHALADIAGAGKQAFIPVPNTNDWKRYVGFQFTVGTAVFTGGTISIEFAANYPRWRAYPAQKNT